MSFYSTYDLTDLVRDDGIKTFSGREIATGRPVQVHLFTRPESLEMKALLKRVAELPPAGRALVIDQGEHEGTPYVVTAIIMGHPGFREWVLSQKPVEAPVPAAPQWAQQPQVQPIAPPAPPPYAAPPPQTAPAAQPAVPAGADDPFASLFKKPGASPPAPPQQAARPQTSRPATE